MCHVKRNNQIETKQDLQNLITAIILRQRGRYSLKYIKNAVEYYMKGSNIEKQIESRELERMICKTLMAFERRGAVRCAAGAYVYAEQRHGNTRAFA